MLFRCVAFALLAMTLPASAQSSSPAEIIRGQCRQDGCDELTIVSKEPLIESDHGILFRTRVRTFLASSRVRADQREENGYVFCSAMTPAIMAERDNQTVAFVLAPFAQRQP